MSRFHEPSAWSMRPMTVTALTRPIVVGEMSFLCGSSLILDQALVIGSHTVAFFGFVFSIIKHQANPKKADSRHFSRYKIIMEHHLKDVFFSCKIFWWTGRSTHRMVNTTTRNFYLRIKVSNQPILFLLLSFCTSLVLYYHEN